MSQSDYYSERDRYRHEDDPRYARDHYPQRPEVPPGHGRDPYPQRPEDPPSHGRGPYPQRPDEPGHGRDPYPQRPEEPPGHGRGPYPQRPDEPGYGKRYDDQPYPRDDPRRGLSDESFGEGSLDYYPGRDRDYPSYTNEGYDHDDEPDDPPGRVYGRRNDPLRSAGNVGPDGHRYGPYGGENKPSNLRPDLNYDDEDDGGFGGNRGRHVSADDVIRNNRDNSRERHASDGQSNLHDRSTDSRMTRSFGMNNLASEAGPAPARSEAAGATRAPPVVTQTPGKWAYPMWLSRPSLILGVIHIALGVLLFCFGCVEASFSDRNLTTAGQGIWSGFIILAAGIIIVLSAIKQKKDTKKLIYVSIALIVCGFIADFIIFGLCAQSISNLNQAVIRYISATSNIGHNAAKPDYDKFYAVNSLLIIFAFTQLVAGIVMLLNFIMALLSPKHQYEYIKKYVYTAADGTNAGESSELFYPELLYRPAIITGASQIVLGCLIFIFGCVEASLHGSRPERPPGFTAAEGVWGGVIIIGAGVATVLAARYKIKLLILVTITATILAILVDVIIFGICGYVVDQMNSKVGAGLYGSAKRHYDLWFAIYDLLIVFAFIHVVIAVVVVFIHAMVFFPSRFYKNRSKKPVASQARVTGRYQTGDQNGVPMSNRRGQPRGPDPRQEALRNIYAPDDQPPRYDDLPPSPDPYNTAAGYDLAFAPGGPRLPEYSERPPERNQPPQQPRQGGRHPDDYAPYPDYDDEPQSPTRPEPPRDYNPSDASYHSQEPQPRGPYPGERGPHPQRDREPYGDRPPTHYGDRGPRHLSDREPYDQHGRNYPEDRDAPKHPDDRPHYRDDRDPRPRYPDNHGYPRDRVPSNDGIPRQREEPGPYRSPRPDYSDSDRGRSDSDPKQYYVDPESRQSTPRDYEGGYSDRSFGSRGGYGDQPLPRFVDRGSTGV